MPNARLAAVPRAPPVIRLPAPDARPITAAVPSAGTTRLANCSRCKLNMKPGYEAWLEALPDTLRESTTAEALRIICDLDLAELQTINPPRGFGRD
jgi:hypothetical protein